MTALNVAFDVWFPICRSLLSLWLHRTRDLFRLCTYDRCNAKLEFFDGFDWTRLLRFHFALSSEIGLAFIFARADFENVHRIAA